MVIQKRLKKSCGRKRYSKLFLSLIWRVYLRYGVGVAIGKQVHRQVAGCDAGGNKGLTAPLSIRYAAGATVPQGAVSERRFTLG